MGIIVANLMVFFYQRSLDPIAFHGFERRFALSLDGFRHGAWWQFLTYQFLHGSLLHLVFNLLFLHSFGPVMESTLGRRRYLTLYLWSGVLGGAVFLLAASVSPAYVVDRPVVGASASLCGLLSALCALYSEEELEVRLFYIFPVVLRAKFLLFLVAAISLAGTVIPLGKVAHSAHLGGLLAGLLYLNLFRVDPLPPARDS